MKLKGIIQESYVKHTIKMTIPIQSHKLSVYL